MAALPRTRRPRTGPWETPNLSQDPPTNIVAGDRSTVRSISSRLWRALRGSDSKTAFYTTQHLRGIPWEDTYDTQDETQWYVWRFLGAGGAASAAVWVKKDVNGELLVEVVLKEQRSISDWFRSGPQRSREAEIQAHVNMEGCESQRASDSCSSLMPLITRC